MQEPRVLGEGDGSVLEQTLVLIKPDGVRKKVIGNILSRYEQKGMSIVALKLMQVTQSLAHRHYEEHASKPFFGGLVDFITSGPIVAMILEAPDVIAIVRLMNGATNGALAQPGTIRGDLSPNFTENVVHASDSMLNAKREIGLFFPELG